MAPMLGKVAKLGRWVTHELPTYVLRGRWPPAFLLTISKGSSAFSTR
ncbi:unnamed protein product [Haemonchus placei]|uniref:Uncharacterized protein n=1 Tax=Haemonchus placei TaxID=6290 RepID=A0A0N4WJ16_HAEPC|nr:unnamed protein product [Haemonchus placei]